MQGKPGRFYNVPHFAHEQKYIIPEIKKYPENRMSVLCHLLEILWYTTGNYLFLFTFKILPYPCSEPFGEGTGKS